MLTLERQNKIMAYLKEAKAATVEELSDMFFVSTASIRRDLSKLEKQQLVKRTYGGVIIVDSMSREMPAPMRRREFAVPKDQIAALAAKRIRENDIILMDASTTTFQIIHYLKNKSGLTIITNGLELAGAASDELDASVYCCGGFLRTNSHSLVGYQAIRFIENFHIQKMFFSCDAITAADGIYFASEEEAELRKVMIGKAEEIYLLCDSSKFDKRSFYRVCGFDRIDYLITERVPSVDWQREMEREQVEISYY